MVHRAYCRALFPDLPVPSPVIDRPDVSWCIVSSSRKIVTVLIPPFVARWSYIPRTLSPFVTHGRQDTQGAPPLPRRWLVQTGRLPHPLRSVGRDGSFERALAGN